MSANVKDVINAFGNPSALVEITHKPLDYDAAHYLRLCRLSAKPDPDDLYSYADDLMYEDIQGHLIFFPFAGLSVRMAGGPDGLSQIVTAQDLWSNVPLL